MAQHMLAERAMREGWAKLLEDLTGLDWERAWELVTCCSALTTTDGRETQLPVDAALVVVESGTVLLAAPAPAGRAPILAFARRGDLLIPPVDREAIVGLGGGSIRIVDAATLKELLAIRGVGPRLVEHLGAVIRDRQESLRLATVSPQRERVRQKLLQLARSHGRVRADGVRIALPLTHDVIARAVGSSRETVTLAMRELRREGFLARSGRSYMLRVHARELDTPAGASAA
jgi:hypothetical protein